MVPPQRGESAWRKPVRSSPRNTASDRRTGSRTSTVGQKFYINSRTQTEAMFAAFQSASGDNHPIHYDREYCKARGHRDLLAHGLQVAIQGAAGAGIFPACRRQFADRLSSSSRRAS